MAKKKSVKGKVHCPNCEQTAYVLYRIRTKTFICRGCSHEWPKK